MVKAGEDIKTKRIKKAVDRTLRWLDDCLTSTSTAPVLAPVVGFDNQEERIRSASEAAKREQVSGFVLNGFELNKDVRMECFKTSIEQLPANKPRLAYGLSTPGKKEKNMYIFYGMDNTNKNDQTNNDNGIIIIVVESILQGVAQGIDLFDDSYAFKMTERGRAITFKFGENMSEPEEGEKPEKTLNLWDTRLAQNFDPIDSSCGCYTCTTPHTKAYIHHLLNAHEMLGPLLIMM